MPPGMPAQGGAPQATPAPIHDIVGPVSFFSQPVWMAILAGVVLLAVLGLVIWLVRRKKTERPLTPKERAMSEISKLREEEGTVEPYAFGVRVSDALRTYLRDEFGVDAVTRTSVEFLESLRDNAIFNENEKAALSEFLESVDLLKYAHLSAGSEEIRLLLEIAERLVQGEKRVEEAKA